MELAQIALIPTGSFVTRWVNEFNNNIMQMKTRVESKHGVVVLLLGWKWVLINSKTSEIFSSRFSKGFQFWIIWPVRWNMVVHRTSVPSRLL